ncbi:MAG: hypothetical protein P4K83_03040 [Terracidiphilus sp.]|nr:hypothetical protein [Terracidiphilus sp.]
MTKWIVFLMILSGGFVTSLAQDVVYQFAVPVASRTAYLWIPPRCEQVRGVVAAFANLTERMWLDDAMARKAMSDECLAALWIGPGDESLLNADLKPGNKEIIEKLFRDLAEVSGFPELANAPVIATGHSAHGQFAWRFAEVEPERTIAAIPIKTVPLPANLQIAGIPLLYIVGESTEWPQYRDGRQGDREFFWPVVRDSARRLRQQNPLNLVAVATDPGGGHFDWNSEDARLMALFLHKACALRLPALNGTRALRPVQVNDGWVVDSAGVDPDRWPPQSLRTFRGESGEAYWAFDDEMAHAIVNFAGDRHRRHTQMLTVEQDGQLLPVAKQGFAAPRFVPESDGVTFQLRPAHLDAVPSELTGAGLPLGHSKQPVRMYAITGPVEQVDPYSFRIAMKRATADGDIWIEETQDGDDFYRKAVQPIRLRVPLKLNSGMPQQIHFSPIADLRAGVHSVRLKATSTSGLPVRFYVDYGPAVVVNGHLDLRDVPLHGCRSIEVRVVAYQWGSLAESNPVDAVQNAVPVSRSFHIETGRSGRAPSFRCR